ncbi:MAG: M1 family aminopeptidase, partial [bacterium]|nr:M1 family aminopeptidase [bacterium]
QARANGIELVRAPEETAYLRMELLLATILPPQFCEVKCQLNYSEDSTLLRIDLNPPLPPQQKLELTLRFDTKIRRYNLSFDKFGYGDNLYEVSQWYPKLCVYDHNGWNAQPYHYFGEFYGEFGHYDVTIDVPDSFIVAATGELVSGEQKWCQTTIDSASGRLITHKEKPLSSGNRKVLTFHAANVHDFVWTASPQYQYEGIQWNDISIHSYYLKSNSKQWRNIALNSAVQALQWLDQQIGEFPYPQLTVCQGLTDGGMEYPMVAVLGYNDFSLVFHEICHQYFQSAVANNETKDGWLDEGLVTFLTEIYQNEKIGDYDPRLEPSIELNFLKDQFRQLSTYNKVRLNALYYYFYSGFEQPLSAPANEIDHLYLYNYHVYQKAARFFSIVDYITGRETFFEILKRFYQSNKFRHVDASLLQQACEEVTETDFSEFFDLWINGIPRVDYAFTGLKSRKNTDNLWSNQLTIKNLGNTKLPVDIQAVTSANDTLRKRFRIDSASATLEWITQQRIKSILLDPADIILDQNRLNNGKLRIKTFLYPELPSMYFLPRDAYSVFLWPQVWYNEIDGAKLGLSVQGSYLNRYYIFRNKVWYATATERFDFRLSYSMPWQSLSKNLWRHLTIQKLDGKLAANVNIQLQIPLAFAEQPAHSFRIGLDHYSLKDKSYGYMTTLNRGNKIRIKTWDEGKLNRVFFHYDFNNRKNVIQSYSQFRIYFAHPAFGSDFKYLRLSLENKFISYLRKWRIEMRSFVGYGDQQHNIPIQDRFWLAEGNPLSKFDYVYLRAPGAMPYWFHYHFPGGGNVRGYSPHFFSATDPISGGKMSAVNFELQHPLIFQIFPRSLQNFAKMFSMRMFFDIGRIWDANIDLPYLMDAGFGICVQKNLLGKLRQLRFDFPIWLSHPDINQQNHRQPNWKFRWLISLQ